MERRILLKFGGNALAEAADLQRFAEDVYTLSQSGFAPIIVHGGGRKLVRKWKKEVFPP